MSSNYKLILSAAEFSLIFAESSFCQNYTTHVKSYLNKKLGLEYTVGKKFLGKKLITISLNCAKYIQNEKCNQHGSMQVKLIDIFGETVTLDVETTCGHIEGKTKYKF